MQVRFPFEAALLISAQAIRANLLGLFARGTREQCVQLVPERSRLQTYSRAPSNGTSNRNRLRCYDPFSYLKEKVIEALENTEQLSNIDCEILWNSEEVGIQLCLTDAKMRLEYLIRGIEKLEKGQSLNACKIRLRLLSRLGPERSRVAVLLNATGLNLWKPMSVSASIDS